MKLYIVTTCLLVSIVISRSFGDVQAPENSAINDNNGYPRYAYAYSVRDPHTDDHKAQYEVRHGNHVIGGFSFVEPGGSVRIVEYKADQYGFINTAIKRLGVKVHPGGADSQISVAIPINGPYGQSTHPPELSSTLS